MPQNQVEIFKRFKLVEGANQVIVEIEPQKSEIKITGQLADDSETYNYLLTVVKLGAVLSDLDLLRVSNNLSEIFPKDACKHMIEDETLSNEFRCLVFNLYASIYILNPVYQYKVARFSDKVIVPDELDIIFSKSEEEEHHLRNEHVASSKQRQWQGDRTAPA
jgi:hypothetical protein